jgi:hypothetical protein
VRRIGLDNNDTTLEDGGKSQWTGYYRSKKILHVPISFCRANRIPGDNGIIIIIGVASLVGSGNGPVIMGSAAAAAAVAGTPRGGVIVAVVVVAGVGVVVIAVVPVAVEIVDNDIPNVDGGGDGSPPGVVVDVDTSS